MTRIWSYPFCRVLRAPRGVCSETALAPVANPFHDPQVEQRPLPTPVPVLNLTGIQRDQIQPAFIRGAFLNELVATGDVTLLHVCTDDELADALTKLPPAPVLLRLRVDMESTTDPKTFRKLDEQKM